MHTSAVEVLDVEDDKYVVEEMMEDELKHEETVHDEIVDEMLEDGLGETSVVVNAVEDASDCVDV